MPQKVNVIQDDDNPVPKDVLATAICKLSDNTNKLITSGLNENAVIVLLADSTKLPKRDIKLVLRALGQLRAHYTHG